MFYTLDILQYTSFLFLDLHWSYHQNMLKSWQQLEQTIRLVAEHKFPLFYCKNKVVNLISSELRFHESRYKAFTYGYCNSFAEKNLVCLSETNRNLKKIFKNKVIMKTCNFIKKGTLSQVFSCEFCDISKSTFFYRTPLVAVSVLTMWRE